MALKYFKQITTVNILGAANVFAATRFLLIEDITGVAVSTDRRNSIGSKYSVQMALFGSRKQFGICTDRSYDICWVFY